MAYHSFRGQAPRVNFCVIVQLYRWFPSILSVLAVIQPETLVRWHRAGFRLHWRWKSRYTTEENGLALRRYWTNACQTCAIKHDCTTAKERRITRWESSCLRQPC